ncbi:EexN family lipoprotein [Pantoea endophytica]|uniref:EexN family lipoprotein n=1 Tax=Pantoea sp. BJ2 TaxID=3141322 RepID=A0AAU7U566_9GAMM
MKKVAFILVISCFGLSSCNEETKSKQWYMDNQSEMVAMFNECKAKGTDSINCRNARSAYFEVKQEKAPIADLN